MARYTKSQIFLFALIAVCTVIAWIYLGTMDHGSGAEDSMSKTGMAGHTDMTGIAFPAPFDALSIVIGHAAIPFGMFIAMWVSMCVAMMLPTAIPMIICLARVAERRSTHPVKPSLAFTAGYIVVWAATGAGAWMITISGQTVMDDVLQPDRNVLLFFATVLLFAGIYQLSPLKYACLKGCRHPASFILHHWRPGAGGAYIMGSLHGAKCVGCCIALMAVMVILGMMNLIWMAIFTLLMFIEKNSPKGVLIGKIAGYVIVACGCTSAVAGILQ
jgi:predicted metal-binding membrane protein